jgi:1,4-alpha-glucan branching enzyme
VAQGYVAIVLHAHLPFVRHPDDPTVMEERWLHEAITGCYLPLVDTFEALLRDGVRVRCTVSLSAPLVSMLADELLQARYTAHLDALIALAERETLRTRGAPAERRLAVMYRERFGRLRDVWRRHERSLVSAFARLQDAGAIELITSTATHAFFPVLDRNRDAIRAQIDVAASLYEEHFGRRPPGMWLGECGYVPGVDELLCRAGVRYCFVDGHALALADRAPAYGVYAPIFCPSGVAAFGRDPESSEQVWSAKQGYPGDPRYRDFYRDIGFDLPAEHVAPFVHPEGHRMATGIKYHAITHEALHDKRLYDPDAARARVGEHAAHFRHARRRQIDRLAPGMDRPPLVVCPYDAELFGHWWYEGPIFLGDLFRQLHHDEPGVEPISPGDYLARHPTNQTATPCASSWGAGGFNAYWLSERTAWIYPHLHAAAERMSALARRFPTAEGPLARALNQAARELLLAQSSDWPFIMQTGTTVPYATRRLCQHIARFNHLCDDVIAGRVDEAALDAAERADAIFPRLDYHVYASEPER